MTLFEKRDRDRLAQAVEKLEEICMEREDGKGVSITVKTVIAGKEAEKVWGVPMLVRVETSKPNVKTGKYCKNAAEAWEELEK